jgi:hypothetical protein
VNDLVEHLEGLHEALRRLHVRQELAGTREYSQSSG